VIGAKPVQCSL